jgi:hypothetical protein
MAKDPFEPFTIPTEMRAFAERSVAQARAAPRPHTAAPPRLRRNRSPMPSRTWPRLSISPRS